MNTWSNSLGCHSEYMHISSSKICHLTTSISVLSYGFEVLFSSGCFFLWKTWQWWHYWCSSAFSVRNPKLGMLIDVCHLVLFICFTVAISFRLQFVLWSFSLWIVQSLISNLWCHFTTLIVVWIEIYFLFVSSLADLFATSSDCVASYSQHL